MTQENKELLLIDLCARLPYRVKIELMPITRGKCATLTPIILRDYFISDDINYLPYLRPMSSMSEEEKLEIKSYLRSIEGQLLGDNGRHIWYFDYLNAHHFDYRGLIEKGLAIAVTEEHNPYK